MRTLTGLLGLLVICPSTLVAAEWGNLTGRLVYGGTPAEPAEVNITSDREYCCQHKVVDESLLVKSENKGIKNVFVFLYQDRRDKTVVPIHDSYQALAGKPLKLDNNQCRFSPHALGLWTKRPLELSNTDPVGHNTKVDTRKNPQTNYTIPAGGKRQLDFANAESFPVQVSCSIHPWMRAWLVIRNNPYVTATDEDGKFELKNLPAGEWSFMFWQEKAGYVREVTVAGKAESWKRGVKSVTIKAGTVSLGDIVVSPKIFEY